MPHITQEWRLLLARDCAGRPRPRAAAGPSATWSRNSGVRTIRLRGTTSPSRPSRRSVPRCRCYSGVSWPAVRKARSRPGASSPKIARSWSLSLLVMTYRHIV